MAEPQMNAFQSLKDALTKEPVLKLYIRGAKTELHTDASKDGFAAVLLQWFDGRLHPVQYLSKKTSKAESRQHNYILEAKAVYLALKKFRHYLLGSPFKLAGDRGFKQTVQKADVPRAVTLCIVYLQDFEFAVEHRPGERLKHVDCLSRYPDRVMLVSSEITVRIKVAQGKDEMLKAIMEILTRCPYKGYKMKGGLVYKEVNGNNEKLLSTTTVHVILHYRKLFTLFNKCIGFLT